MTTDSLKKYVRIVEGINPIGEAALDVKKLANNTGHLIKWMGGKGRAAGTYLSKFHPTNPKFNAANMQPLKTHQINELSTDTLSSYVDNDPRSKSRVAVRGMSKKINHFNSHRADDGYNDTRKSGRRAQGIKEADENEYVSPEAITAKQAAAVAKNRAELGKKRNYHTYNDEYSREFDDDTEYSREFDDDTFYRDFGDGRRIYEGTREYSDSMLDELHDLLTIEGGIPLGVDAVNAIAALGGLIGDDSLNNKLENEAHDDPDADAVPIIIAWVEENMPEYFEKFSLSNNVTDA